MELNVCAKRENIIEIQFLENVFLVVEVEESLIGTRRPANASPTKFLTLMDPRHALTVKQCIPGHNLTGTLNLVFVNQTKFQIQTATDRVWIVLKELNLIGTLNPVNASGAGLWIQKVNVSSALHGHGLMIQTPRLVYVMHMGTASIQRANVFKAIQHQHQWLLFQLQWLLFQLQWLLFQLQWLLFQLQWLLFQLQ